LERPWQTFGDSRPPPVVVYVLHAFEKQSRRTARVDVEIWARRYREVIAGRRP
jgi:phage-related protein